MEIYIGQTFDGKYPPEAAIWCNGNNAHIEKTDSTYTIVKNAKPIPTKAELTDFVSAEADKIAFGGITVVSDGEKYLFKTDTDNIARCGAVMPAYDVMSDEQVIPWEVWKDDLIYMLQVSKVQFKNGYLFGVQMTIEVQNIKGTVCAEIKNLTDEQLSDEIFITTFKENVINQLNSVNTKFELN
jgi:hypothetical protein